MQLYTLCAGWLYHWKDPRKLNLDSNNSLMLPFPELSSKLIGSPINSNQKTNAVYICVCVRVCVLLSSNQNQRGGDVTGWKGGLQNECQFIEAQPHSHNQHVLYWFEWWRNSIYFWLRNLEWWEWKSTYTKYQRRTMGKLQQCYFCLLPDINKNKLFFRFK